MLPSDKKEPPRRGRPRAFDHDVAVRRAMHVFWAYGYDGATMHRLVEAMGIGSPSIYAAFGDKLGLFRKAVALYGSGEGDAGRRALREIPDLRKALLAMLRATVDILTAPEIGRGCLVTLGASALGVENDPARVVLKGERDRTRRCLTNRFAAEADRNHGIGDPTVLAGAVMAFLSGLSIEVADGAPASALHRSVEVFVDGLLRV